jgi:hypothetical protein
MNKKNLKEKISQVKKVFTKKQIGEGFGISGFIYSILSILFSGFVGLFFAIPSLVLCIYQQKHQPTKIGKAGLILSILAIILSIAWIIFSFKYYL